MNKQVLIKLATLRLAINYVLRNRYLTKQGFVKQAIGPGAGTTRETAQPGDSVNNHNGLIPPINTDPNRQNFPSIAPCTTPVIGYKDGKRTWIGSWYKYPTLDPVNQKKSTTYNSIEEFKKSKPKGVPTLYPGDTIKLPRGNLLVNNNNTPIYLDTNDSFLSSIFRSEQELNDLAPFAPFGHVHILPTDDKNIEAGYHDPWTHNIFYHYSDDPEENRDTTTHEPSHTSSIFPRYTPWYNPSPYEHEIEPDPKKVMDWTKGVERYTLEENAVMGEQGAKTIDERPEGVPSYRIFSRVPYLWNLPNTYTGPLGRPSSYPITKKEWIGYTMPQKLNGVIGFGIKEPPNSGTDYYDNRDNVTYNLLEYLYKTGYLTPENFFQKIENGYLDKPKEEEDIKNMGSYLRYNMPDYEEVINDDGINESKIPINMFSTESANEIARFIGDNPELYRRLSNLPEDNLTSIALNTALSNVFSASPSKELTSDAITDLEEVTNAPLIGDTPNYQKFLIREALGNLARRGINIIGEDHSPFVKAQHGDVTVHAPMQGLSQQRDPYTKNTYARLQKQVLSKLQDYNKNPRYFNIMKKWHLSPFGDSMLGVNKFSLTIEQMKQILKDFEQEDKNQQIENSKNFQGYQPQSYSEVA